LAIGGEDGALAEIGFAGADQDGVVGVNLDPGVRERRVDLIARSCDGFLRRICF
jgi:hypothetical protein